MADNPRLNKTIPLTGRLITSQDPTTIGENFQSLKNLRYKDSGLQGVGGMTKINTSGLANPKITGGIHLLKTQPSENHVVVQAFDYSDANPKIYDNTTAIPNQGNFSGTALYTEDTSADVGFFSKAPGEQIAFCDSKESLIWGGDEMRVAGFIVFDAAAGTFLYDYSEAVNNTLSTSGNTAVMVSDANNCTWYVGSTRPLKGVKFYVSSANAVTATLAGWYWSGTAWTSVSSLTDGTLASGKTLAQTGSVTFTDTVSVAKPKLIDGVMLYWYKFQTSAAITATTAINYCTVNASMQTIKNLWDGVLRPVLNGQKYRGATDDYYDWTVNIAEADFNNDVALTYLNLNSLVTTADLFFGFSEPQMGLFIKIGDEKNNTNAVTMAVYKWSGAAWTAVTGLVDGTAVTGKPLARTGYITWEQTALGSEFKTNIANDKKLYYYKMNFSGQLSATVKVDQVLGIAAPYPVTDYKFPVLAQERLWLLNNISGKRNSARCSARYTTEVWDGEDTEIFEFGDESELTGGGGITLYTNADVFNLIFFTKKTETYAVIGSSPQDWRQYIVSTLIGCVAPRTIKTLNINIPNSEIQNKQVAFWQSNHGIHLFDGRAILLISGDISSYFDPNKDECITPSMIMDSAAFVDHFNQEYHWIFFSGDSAEKKELVYDFKRNKWFEIVRQ